jgi:hypothetical protein
MIARFLAFLFLALAAAPACAGPMKAERDCSAHPEYLKLMFTEYNHDAKNTIYYEQTGVRFWHDPKIKSPKQVGLYSSFTLIGDFEVSVRYEWLQLGDVKKGYGVSSGIAVDFQNTFVQIARGFQVGRGDRVIVTEKKVEGGETKYIEPKSPRETKAKSGRLALRREKAEILCLFADGDETLEELCRVPFTTQSVRKVRLFVDPGGEPNYVDVKLTQIRFRAEEIEGDIPESERSSAWIWWVGVTLFVLAFGVLLGLWWRQKRAE